jgi:SAM-dependent methyltransferase
MKMLNIGCGEIYHSEWINLDLISHSAQVLPWDITKGLPFESNSFDVCYSSHVLEHLRRSEAKFLVEEQKRILKHRGILRLAVPDLETICRNYLRYLDELCAGNLSHEFRYDYTLLEMLDQATREASGGELGRLWASGIIPDLQFVISRHGKEVEMIPPVFEEKDAGWSRQLVNRVQRLFDGGRRKFIFNLRLAAAKLAVVVLLGTWGLHAFRDGIFRNSGEIHRIMYDRYSLKRLLSSCGFVDIQACRANESRIPDFNTYRLDFIDGVPRKPDSLFLEAISGLP